MDIDQINNSDTTHFVELLGGIFEHSPWVAERVYSARPFASRTDLHLKMVAEVRKASTEQRRELLCQHPELAGKEADEGSLTDASFKPVQHRRTRPHKTVQPGLWREIWIPVHHCGDRTRQVPDPRGNAATARSCSRNRIRNRYR